MTPGISASRLADITAIPRQTVRRKLMALEQIGWARQTADQTWCLTVREGGTSLRSELAETDARAMERIARLYAELEGIVERAKQGAQNDQCLSGRACASKVVFLGFDPGRPSMFDPAQFRLDGKTAIVTGAGAGIGRGIALMFAAAGASIVVSDLRAETAQAVAQEIVSSGGRAIGVACNVTRPDNLTAVVTTAIDRFGRIDILVNNAGGGGPKPFDMPMEDFRWAYELNVFSVFHLSQLVAPHMRASGGGAILNITSMAGENKNTRMASYASSKAAENHLTRNIAFDLGPMGIRVNAIAPGAIKTDALASVLTPETEKAMLKHTPLGRLGEAADIAQAALFLCAPASSWISGQILTVSGGGLQELD
jgi:7-alpha-hydroxysteroid dehydrogenase